MAFATVQRLLGTGGNIPRPPREASSSALAWVDQPEHAWGSFIVLLTLFSVLERHSQATWAQMA